MRARKSEHTNTHKRKQTVWGERPDFKKEKSLKAHAPRDLLIPLLRELKEERWATDCWAGLHPHFNNSLRWRGGKRSEALSTAHKEKGKVKEDYKKKKERQRERGGMFKERKSLAELFCVWHSGQRHAGFSQWETFSTPARSPSTPQCLQKLLLRGRTTGNQRLKRTDLNSRI